MGSGMTEEILGILEDPRTGAGDLVDALERRPEQAAAVLQFASGSGKVLSLPEAVRLLGFSGVRRALEQSPELQADLALQIWGAR